MKTRNAAIHNIRAVSPRGNRRNMSDIQINYQNQLTKQRKEISFTVKTYSEFYQRALKYLDYSLDFKREQVVRDFYAKIEEDIQPYLLKDDHDSYNKVKSF